MNKILKTEQIKQLDALAIVYESITSFDLMKRATDALYPILEGRLQIGAENIIIAGSGNNGGDALCIAKKLIEDGKKCDIYLVNPKNKLSGDCEKALKNLVGKTKVKVVTQAEEIEIPNHSNIIDGLFGSGLNRPLEGVYADIVKKINQHDENSKVYAIDLPSGLFGEDNSANNKETIIKADYSYVLSAYKPCCFFAENEDFIGDIEFVKFKIDNRAFEEVETPYYLTEGTDINAKLHVRKKFSHKGTFGHALIVAGQYGMMGAAVLSSKAALRSGCGLVTAHVPRKGCDILQITNPEVILSLDKDEEHFTGIDSIEKYSAVGVGPGLGQSEESATALLDLLKKKPKNLVLDADALNILSQHPEYWEFIPENTIITPHPKEFERLVGRKVSGYDAWQEQIKLSTEKKIIVVLKGAYSSISFPDGTLHVNTTGNSGMATAGSGDVLTGIITSLLAQKYTPQEAAVLGVYLHGFAADIAVHYGGSEESMIASDIIQHLGESFR